MMSLVWPDKEAGRTGRVWVGDGLPSVPKKLHEQMVRWEFVDFSELRPVGALEKLNEEHETQNYIIGPGFRVAKAKNKPVDDIMTWLQCFAVYVAVMSKDHPEVVPDMMHT